MHVCTIDRNRIVSRQVNIQSVQGVASGRGIRMALLEVRCERPALEPLSLRRVAAARARVGSIVCISLSADSFLL